MKNILTKILLALCLVLLALNVYNSKSLEGKTKEIASLSEKQIETQKKVDSLNKQIGIVSDSIKQADASWESLNKKIQSLEKNKKNYTEKVQEIKNENDEVKAFLDTRIPNDLKRLLDESINPTKP